MTVSMTTSYKAGVMKLRPTRHSQRTECRQGSNNVLEMHSLFQSPRKLLGFTNEMKGVAASVKGTADSKGKNYG